MLEPLGYERIRAARTLTGCGYGRDSVAFWVVSAEGPVPGTKNQVCTSASGGRPQKRSMHFTRLRLVPVGRTTGGPGLRPEYDPNFYAAFVIDPGGYRIEAYYGPEKPEPSWRR